MRNHVRCDTDHSGLSGLVEVIATGIVTRLETKWENCGPRKFLGLVAKKLFALLLIIEIDVNG